MRIRIVLFPLFVVAGLLAACGGAQQGPAVDCYTANEDLLATPPESICSFASLESFEMVVVSHRDSCELEMTPNHKARLSQLLGNGRKCADQEEYAAPLRKECAERVEIMNTEEECLGEDCTLGIEDMEIIIEDCKDPVLDGPHMVRARSLLKIMKERRRDVAQLTPLIDLEQVCSRQAKGLKPHRAKEIFGSIVPRFRRAGVMQGTITQGSQIHLNAQAALDACEAPLRFAIEELVVQTREKLEDPKISGNEKKRNRYIGKVDKWRARLLKSGAGVLLPGISEVFDGFLTEHDIELKEVAVKAKPAKGEPEPEPEPEEDEAAEPSGEDAAEADEEGADAGEETAAGDDSSAQTATPAQCKGWKKKATQFEKKAKAYEKKKPKKSEAYQKKLEKVRQKQQDGGCSE